jgi:hypothetical protein
MPRKARKTQYQFGSAAGAEEIAKFGSFAAGSPTYTTDPEVIQDLVQYDQGWQGAAVGLSPAIEDRNALDYLFAYQLQYLLEQGIPEWDAETTYFIGQVVAVGDQYGFQYVSLANDNLNHAVTDTLWWRKIDGQVTATKTAGFTLGAADNGCIFPINTTAGGLNITLPTGGAPKNYRFTIKDVGGALATNPVSIVRIGSEYIDGIQGNYTCNRPGRAYTFVSDGSNWWLVSNTVDTRIGIGETFGESLQNAVGSHATGANIVGATANVNALIVQQKNSTAGQSLGALIRGGTNSSDYCTRFVDNAGTNFAQFRGDKILEMIGGGIKFPATAVASSDANVLDDYEEGTFTPTLAYNTPGTSSFTYSFQLGRYIKIGTFVFFVIRIGLSAFTKGTATGVLRVANLPFTTSNTVAAAAITTVMLDGWTSTGIPYGFFSVGGTVIDLYAYSSPVIANLGDPSATSAMFMTGSFVAVN